MKNSLFKYCLLLLITTWPLLGIGQTHYYDLISKKDTLGVLTVSKQKQNDKINYHYKIDMQVSMLVKVNIKYTLKATYSEKMLLSATINNNVNGKPYHSSDINWNGSYYIINTEDKINQKHTEPIIYSTIRFFFDEPLAYKEVFSELFGSYGSIKPLTKNTYVLTLPNGKKNQYTYSEGKMILAEIGNSIVKFHLVKRKK